MSDTQTINTPDIGDFDDVPVIEILVKPGDRVEKDQSLVTLESEKATMEVPCPVAGEILTVEVSEGQRVSQGAPLVTVRVDEKAHADADAQSNTAEKPDASAVDAGAQAAPQPAPNDAEYDTELLVIGAGPGGYTAAFRAADLGMQVTLVEKHAALGGVCLNVGCIPSKALLHAAEVIREAEHMGAHGVQFGAPQIDREKLLGWKDGVVERLTGGLKQMAKQRQVKVVQGEARFVDGHHVEINGEKLSFAQCIIAAGSRVFKLPLLPWGDARVMDSTDALVMQEVPANMLIIGCGIIGLEMATVYSALGCEVTLVEMMDQIIPGADKDLVRPLHTRIKKQYKAIKLGSQVTAVDVTDDGLRVTFDGQDSETFEKVLVAVGREPNGDRLDAENAGVKVTDRGFIEVDRQMRTNVPHIFAIGDVVGQPMLAHKATHEAKVAAEAAHGEKVFFDAHVIPSVAYTDPEVAWVGVTETQAQSEGRAVGVGKFPWAASGRALGIARTEGFTKLLFDEETGRVIGGGIVGPNAGELIAEVALAIEMGCEAADIGLTIHPHPTLSESVAMSAEAFEGTITDLYLPKRKQ